MIVALCSTGEDLHSEVDERFGRSSYFAFYDTESEQTIFKKNEARQAAGGAGTLAVQQLLDNDTVVAIVPELGPQAHDAFEKFHIRAYKQVGFKTVNEALCAWKENKLDVIKSPGNNGLHKV